MGRRLVMQRREDSVIRVSELAYVHTTVHDTFAFASDYRSFGLWSGAVRQLRAAGEGPLDEGGVFDALLDLGPTRRWFRFRLEQMDEDRAVVFVGTAMGVQVRYAIHVTASGPGAQLRLETTIRLAPWLWPARYFVASRAREASTDSTRRLQRILGDIYQMRRRGLEPSWLKPGAVQVVLT